jgi:methylated-DNA-[protein]-cysteine S-methyltransferase
VSEVISFVPIETSQGTAALAYELLDGSPVVVAVAMPAHTEAATLRALERSAGAPVEPALEPHESMGRAARDVGRAIDGEAVSLDWVPIDERRFSPLRRDVYAFVRSIPRGEVRSYADVARAATGSSSASRAVGRLLATNPLLMIVPCHRVVGAEGELHGFSAPGGVRTKAELLEREGVPLASLPLLVSAPTPAPSTAVVAAEPSAHADCAKPLVSPPPLDNPTLDSPQRTLPF